MDGKQVECLSSIIAVLILGIVIIVHEFGHFYWQDEWHRVKNFCGNGTKDTVNAAGNDEVFTETDSFWRFLYDAGGRWRR